MYKKIRETCAALPTPLSGLALGLASLGLGLENALPLHSLGQLLGALAALFLLGMVAVKYVVNPGLVRQDVAHPVMGSIMPTFAMALMLVSKTLGVWNATAGEVLWLFAVALHLALMLAFTYFRARSFSLQQMLPSWFIPFVGVILAAVTVPGDRHTSLAYALMVFGMANYALLLPVMLYRLIFSAEVLDAAKPTFAVMAAPASLALVGYLSLEPDPSLLLCSLLLGIALLMTFLVYIAFFKLLRLPFSPAFASYTFPMAVGATALYKLADHLHLYPGALAYAAQLRVLAVVEMVVASLVAAYVCFRYALYFAEKLHLPIPAWLRYNVA